MTIREFLLSIHVLQIKEVEVTLTIKDGLERKVLGFRKWHRVNPYNPISYVVVLLMLVLGFLLFGIIGMWKEVDWLKNPFKWQ